MNVLRTFLTRAAVLLVVSGLAIAGCGRSDLLGLAELPGADAGPDAFPDVILPNDVISVDVTPTDSVPPPGTCGDHVCDDGETCSTCPEDCGLCPGCGDGKCDNGETCVSCPPDCGVCPRCGDGVCTPDETCYSCPEDCGSCPGCGDGKCESDETCASCEVDCGPCAVCGNGVCQGPYEDCSNCPADCGACPTTTCLGLITCSLRCANPLDLACIQDCFSGACADAVYFAQNVLTCAISNVGTCGGQLSIACVEAQCPSQITACLGSTCPATGM